jgi:hypothetical protein
MSVSHEDLLPQLTTQERASPTWQKLLAHFNAQLAACRGKNDGDLNPTETAGMRARIAVYKALAALNEDRVPLED